MSDVPPPVSWYQKGSIGRQGLEEYVRDSYTAVRNGQQPLAIQFGLGEREGMRLFVQFFLDEGRTNKTYVPKCYRVYVEVKCQ